jgi:purine-binding chemotaxis protein CheW
MNDNGKILDSYILFEVAGNRYGLRSYEVQHMEMVDQITPVPHAAPFLDGVAFSRGQVVPVINMRARFGLPRAEHSLRSRLIVVKAGERVAALLVDGAREFLQIPKEAIQPPHDAMAGLSRKWLSGIATVKDQLILLLSLDAILNIDLAPELVEQGIGR